MAELYWPSLVAALLALWRADATLTAAEVEIYDGPPAAEVSAGRTELFVGATGMDFGEGEQAGSTDSEWVATGGERGHAETVICGLWLQRGEDAATTRAALAELMTAIAASLRTYPYGLGVDGMFQAELASIGWMQQQTPQGVSLGVVFTVSATTRTYAG